MRHVRSVARSLWLRVQQRVQRLGHLVWVWWTKHRDRMEIDEYAEAFVSVVIAAVEILIDSRRASYLTREIAAAYIAILRALRADPDDGDLGDLFST